MLTSLLDPTPFLTNAGAASALKPWSDKRRNGRGVVRSLLCLVAAALAADDAVDGYASVFRQLDIVQRQLEAAPGDGETNYIERIVDALPLSGEPATALIDCLAAYERFLAREARLDDALCVLALEARAYGDALALPMWAAFALRAGRWHRLLARWDVARACYGAAHEAGRGLQDEAIRLRGRLGFGEIYRAQGELGAAKTTVEVVLREADRLDLCDLHALAYWDFGVILRLEGAVGEGLQVVRHASQVLLDANDRLHALRDVGLAYAALGARTESRAAFNAVLDMSDAALLRTSVLIGLMDIESADGDRLAFERRSDEIKRMPYQMPPGMAVAHRYKLGQGLARFGHGRQAQTVLSDALALARANRLHGWCREIEGRLGGPMAKAG